MAKVEQAVILAAGLGIRLPSFHRRLPKGFLEVNGTILVERTIEILLKAGIKEIIIGTGYQSETYEALVNKFPQVACVYNPRYHHTGSMYTLHNLRESVHSDFLLFESDILYEEFGVASLLEHSSKNVILASGFTHAGDEVYIQTDPDINLVDMSKNKQTLGAVYGELTGISKVSHSSFQIMCEDAGKLFDSNPKLDYEYAMVGVANREKFHVLKIQDFIWCEIDTEEHLLRAQNEVHPMILHKEQPIDKP